VSADLPRCCRTATGERRARYSSRERAEAAARRYETLYGDRLEPYPCQESGLWHVRRALARAA